MATLIQQGCSIASTSDGGSGRHWRRRRLKSHFVQVQWQRKPSSNEECVLVETRALDWLSMQARRSDRRRVSSEWSGRDLRLHTPWRARSAPVALLTGSARSARTRALVWVVTCVCTRCRYRWTAGGHGRRDRCGECARERAAAAVTKGRPWSFVFVCANSDRALLQHA